jgi:hypothetical protein
MPSHISVSKVITSGEKQLMMTYSGRNTLFQSPSTIPVMIIISVYNNNNNNNKSLLCNLTYTSIKVNFTFSEPCVVIHTCEKDQKDAHFFLIISFT